MNSSACCWVWMPRCLHSCRVGASRGVKAGSGPIRPTISCSLSTPMAFIAMTTFRSSLHQIRICFQNWAGRPWRGPGRAVPGQQGVAW